jgi:hypothetical protein
MRPPTVTAVTADLVVPDRSGVTRAADLLELVGLELAIDDALAACAEQALDLCARLQPLSPGS